MRPGTVGIRRNGDRRAAVAAACGLLVLGATASAMTAAAATPEPSARRVDSGVSEVRFDVVGGRWNFVGRNATLKDIASAIAAKVPVEIRIQDPTLEAAKLGVAFEGTDAKTGMDFVLAKFNFSQFDDPKSGRRVYLVTSYAKEVKPTPEAKPMVATVAATSPNRAAGGGSAKVVTSIDDFRKVQPARIRERDQQTQAEIEAEFKREKEEKLLRAIDALKSKDVNSAVQVQALADLSASGDPRATAVLQDAWAQVQGNPAAAQQVARSAWQNAAQLQFANADANALLLSMTSSQNTGVREVAQAGRQDMERYRAAQNPR